MKGTLRLCSGSSSGISRGNPRYKQEVSCPLDMSSRSHKSFSMNLPRLGRTKKPSAFRMASKVRVRGLGFRRVVFRV